jgi:hypothetical protein
LSIASSTFSGGPEDPTANRKPAMSNAEINSRAPSITGNAAATISRYNASFRWSNARISSSESVPWPQWCSMISRLVRPNVA